MENISAKAPWKSHLGEVPFTLDYFDGSMFEAVEKIAEKYPNNIAFDFMGRSTTYKALVREVEDCAKALRTIGVREGDKVTIAMPNCPQAIQMFYAVNLIGGICNMIHPLSAEKEIEFYLNESESVTAITLDQFYNKFENIRQNTKVVNIVIASIKDELSKPVKAGYMLTEGRKIKKIPEDAPVIRWKEFLHMGKHCFYNYKVKRTGKDPAVILYSGGTTGTTKGILLSNRNFNALGQQVIAANPMFRVGDKMLAAMPLFHGFGLGVCIHTMLSQGGRCILIPRFTAQTYAKQITKYHCNFIAGVPTLYEALLRLPSMDNADLSSLKGVFSGGDCVSGPATVIRAVAAGKVAADNIDAYLGFDHKIRSDVEIPPAHLSYTPPCGRVNLENRHLSDYKGDFTLVKEGMTLEEAQQEASRCLRCDHFGFGIFKGGRNTEW